MELALNAGRVNTHYSVRETVELALNAGRVNMHYSARETVELALNAGSDLEDFCDWF